MTTRGVRKAVETDCSQLASLFSARSPATREEGCTKGQQHKSLLLLRPLVPSRTGTHRFDSKLSTITQHTSATMLPTPRPRRSDVDRIVYEAHSRRREVVKGKLGTIKGVFVPTLQNIMGIILFVRVPFIVGEAGILEALGIVWLSCATALLTAVSMSAVATNGVPRSGGCYATVKNSLGAQFGGVTGALLFLSNTFGVAMYVLGCVEVLQLSFPATFGDLSSRILGAIILGGLTLIVFVGVEYVARFAVLFLVGVVLAVAATFAGVVVHSLDDKPRQGIVGVSAQVLRNNLWSAYNRRAGTRWSFKACLALFFPAVTDPLAGSNLSGDLKDPQASIPPGTLAAVLVTTIVFTVQVILVSGSARRDALIEFPLEDFPKVPRFVVKDIAWPHELVVVVGVLLSTLGAGLQSLAGAPRLLAALGKDDLVPVLRHFAPNEGAEPRRAILFCAALSMCCVMAGDLNAVAPFITLWFLTCYAIINLACAYLGYEKHPSFRPTFRLFDWRVSLVGSCVCFFIMFYTQPLSAAGALALAGAIYKYIETQPGASTTTAHGESELPVFEREPSSPGASDSENENMCVSPAHRTGPADWRSGSRFKRARNAMLALEEGDLQFKYWRPFVLFLCEVNEGGDYVRQRGMLDALGQLVRRGKGLALVNGVLEGQAATPALVTKARRAQRRLRSLMRARGVPGFADVVFAPSTAEGHRLLLQAKGLGHFRPNTVALGWPTGNTRDARVFLRTADDTTAVRKTLLVFAGDRDFPGANDQPLKGRVDVWMVFDLFPAAGLLLLIPFLLLRDDRWKQCELRLVIVSPRTDAGQKDDGVLETAVKSMLKAGGVLAAVLVLRLDAEDAPRFARDASARTPQASVRTRTRGLTRGSSLTDSQEAALDEFALPEPPLSPPSPMRRIDSTGKTKLTQLVEEHSGESELVLIALPKQKRAQPPAEWMLSVDRLIEGLRRVILIRESGAEKVQFFQ